MADLVGCRVLLVEDEYMLAQDLRNELEDRGVVVLGPEASVEQALKRVARETRIDAAVLDINLGGKQAFAVADALIARHVPIIFSSGYSDGMTDDRYPDVVRCDKPLNMRALLSTIGLLIADQ